MSPWTHEEFYGLLTIDTGGIRRGSMARRQMTMPGAIVSMCLAQLDTDEVQLTMTHTSFGNDLLGELPNCFRGAL
jgi:hypothetical protein